MTGTGCVKRGVASAKVIATAHQTSTWLKLVVTRGGLVSKSLCGIPYKKFFKIPERPLFGTFCMGDYKSLAAIAALSQWQLRTWW
jgi:hypothetical protein